MRRRLRRAVSACAAALTVVAVSGASMATLASAPAAGASTAPAPPVITGPASGTVEATATFTVHGTASPTAGILVAATGSWIASTAAGSTGTWSLHVTLAAGSRSLEATEVTTGGATITSAAVSVTVDGATTTGRSVLVNGGFETPVVAKLGTSTYSGLPSVSKYTPVDHTTWANFSSIPGWAPTVTTCPSGSQYSRAGVELQTEATATVIPVTGAQYAELAPNCVSGLSQAVTTVPGQEYQLTFSYRARPTTAPADNLMSVTWNGSPLAATLQGTTTAWSTGTYTVTATSSSTAVQFNDQTATPSVSVGDFLDAVSLDPILPATVTSSSPITAPATGATETSPTVTVTGTAPPHAIVVVTATGKPVSANYAKSDGTWRENVTLLQGAHSIAAYVQGTPGTGPLSAPVAVTVSSDTLIDNGTFAIAPPLGSAPFLTVDSGNSTTIPGWSVFTPASASSPTGSVDDIPSSYWNSVHGPGDNSIDLAGSTSAPGGLYQTVPTTPGEAYTVTFYSAVNGDQAPGVVHDLTFSAGPPATSPLPQIADIHQAGAGRPLQWEEHTYQVTATGPITRLSFADITPGDVNQGPAIDDVSMVPSSSLGPSNTNTRWQTAVTPAASGATTRSLRYSDEHLWFKFPIGPDEQVSVTASNVHSNDEVLLYSTITALYHSLATTNATVNLAALEAERPTNNANPVDFASLTTARYRTAPQTTTARYRTAPLTTTARYRTAPFVTPAAFTTTARYRTAPLTTTARYRTAPLTTTARYRTAPQVTTARYRTAPGETAVADSLLGTSTQQGNVTKTVQAGTFNKTGYFYVEVVGVGGVASAAPFTLSVAKTGTACASSLNPSLVPAPLPSNGTHYSSVIVVDSQTMPTVTTTATGSLGAYLTQLATRTKGVVVNVASSPLVAALTTQARAHATCPYAVDLEAQAIADIVNSYRAPGDSPSNLQYVVLVGDDDVIPFFRYADVETISPESGYVVPLTSGSEPQAAINNNYFLTDDPYGATTSLTIDGSTLPVQTAAVGRLVETPADIIKTVQAFLAKTGTSIRPTSSLSAGYSFMADPARQIAGAFSAGGITGSANAQLITKYGVKTPGTPPTGAWTATVLSKTLTKAAHQLVFLGAHFSASAMLAADLKTTLTTKAFSSEIGTTLSGSLVLSAGCHAGYTIDPQDDLRVTAGTGSVTSLTRTLAWPQAFTEAGATLVAGTGFQYGDTNYVADSDQVYTDLAHQLDYKSSSGSVHVGSALLSSEWQFLADQEALNGLDEKSVLEVTLYGLPMLGVTMPSLQTAPAAPSSQVTGVSHVTTGPGATLGLERATLAVTPSYVATTATTSGRTYYKETPGGVTSEPGTPVVPVDTVNVNVPNETLRGVGLWSASYTDSSGGLPVLGDPVTVETTPTPPPFSSTTFSPEKIWNPNYFGTIAPTTRIGTQLGITPMQYVLTSSNPTAAVRRAYSSLTFHLFYSAAKGGVALAAPPAVSNVSVTTAGATVTVSATVAGTVEAGVQDVWTTYTDPAASPRWTSTELTRTPASPSTWKATFADAHASASDFIVQAANGVGQVSLDQNTGAYFRSAPAIQQSPATYSLSLNGSPVSGAFGSTATVTATLTPTSSPAGSVGGRAVSFAVGSARGSAYTAPTGTATAHIALTGLPPGTYPMTASFRGDASDAGAATSATFQVVAVTTALAITAPSGLTSGQTSGVSATLTSGGKPLGGQFVYFAVTSPAGTTVGGSVATTTPAGVAYAGVLTVPAGDAGTGYHVTAYFSTGATPTTGGPVNAAVTGYEPSASAGGGVGVTDDTAVSLVPNPSPARFGQAVTLTATVSPTGTSGKSGVWPTAPGATVPTGAITFKSGARVLGTAPLSLRPTGADSATLTTKSLQGGTDTLSALYAGNAYLAKSTASTTEAVGFTQTIAGQQRGPLRIGSGQVVLVTGKVLGPITIAPGGGLEVQGGTVAGPVSAAGAIGITFCGATVNGPVTAIGSAGYVFIGGGTNGCAPSTVSGPITLLGNKGAVDVATSTLNGPLTLLGNTGGVVIEGSTVHGPVTALINSGGTEIAGNTISGPLSCAGNTPAPTDAGQPNKAPVRSGQCDSPKTF